MANAAEIHIHGADDYLEDAVCLLGHLDGFTGENGALGAVADRTVRMAIEKIRKAQHALDEAKSRLHAGNG